MFLTELVMSVYMFYLLHRQGLGFIAKIVLCVGDVVSKLCNRRVA